MLVVILLEEGTEVVAASLHAREPDLALVDALLRMKLIARRCGWRMRLDDPSDELRALLDFVGLGEALGLEACGKAELGEQGGVQEVVQPGDPPA